MEGNYNIVNNNKVVLDITVKMLLIKIRINNNISE